MQGTFDLWNEGHSQKSKCRNEPVIRGDPQRTCLSENLFPSRPLLSGHHQPSPGQSSRPTPGVSFCHWPFYSPCSEVNTLPRSTYRLSVATGWGWCGGEGTRAHLGSFDTFSLLPSHRSSSPLPLPSVTVSAAQIKRNLGATNENHICNFPALLRCNWQINVKQKECIAVIWYMQTWQKDSSHLVH